MVRGETTFLASFLTSSTVAESFLSPVAIMTASATTARGARLGEFLRTFLAVAAAAK
ncbi:hypothetical protein D3C85_1847080 [compost metagenome]